MRINYNRQMQEFVLPKGDVHDAMQVYIYPGKSTVVFFHRERASADIVPYFAMNCEVIQNAGFCVWYLDVPNWKIEQFLADNGL